MRQFGNCAATPVGFVPRILSRVVNGALGSVILVIGTVLPRGALSNGDYQLAILLTAIGGFLGLLLAVVQVVLILTKSATVGHRVTKVMYLKAVTGEAAKGQLFLRYLVSGLFEGVTLGLGAFSYFFGYRDGQHWLDRALGTVAVERDSARWGSAPHPQGIAQTGHVPGGVTPVRVPARQPTLEGFTPTGSAPGASFIPGPSGPNPAPATVHPASTSFAPPTPVAPVSAIPSPVGSTPSVRTESVPFGPSRSSFAPGPAGPSPEPSRAAASAWPSPPAPRANPFLPPGQAEFGQGKPATSMPSQAPNAMESDETVLDPEHGEPATPVVVLDDGTLITLDGPIVLGRNPVAPEEYFGARCIPVADTSMRVSKTHLALLAVDGEVKVIDLGATNGIALETDGVRTRLAANQTHLLADDAILHFGGRNLKVAAR